MMFKSIIAGAKAVLGMGDVKGAGIAAVKEVAEWIDQRKFTPEEQAEYVLKVAPVYAKFMENTVNENSERSKTRRQLAILVIRNWVAMLWAAIFAWLWKPEWSSFILTIALSTALISLVLGIGAFFWGTHLLRGTPLKKDN